MGQEEPVRETEASGAIRQEAKNLRRRNVGHALRGYNGTKTHLRRSMKGLESIRASAEWQPTGVKPRTPRLLSVPCYFLQGLLIPELVLPWSPLFNKAFLFLQKRL